MNQHNNIRIATRKSPLALWQAEFVRQALSQLDPKLNITLVPLMTEGDKTLNQSLSKVGGKGLFIKELEIALLEDRADIAVHSMKDVPSDLPDELSLAAICQREDPLDAFVSNIYDSLEHLPSDAIVGTSSLRRRSQILALRPDLTVKNLRGNLDTRLKKLDDNQYDAIILASAGLIRLDLRYRIKSQIPTETMLPAVGQGAIGIECKKDNEAILQQLMQLNHEITLCCLTAERAFNKRLNGSCQIPIAGFAELLPNNELNMRGLVASPDGKQRLTATHQMPINKAEALGDFVAAALLEQGADNIIQNAIQHSSTD